MVPILQVRNCGTEVLNGSARMHGADFPQDRKSQRLQMGTQEYCSGALNPKAVLGEMGALGGRRRTQMQVPGGNSGWSEATPGGPEENGSSVALPCSAMALNESRGKGKGGQGSKAVLRQVASCVQSGLKSSIL